MLPSRRRFCSTSSRRCCAPDGQKGELTALVVDEAQSLNAELLEEIRLLANIETATDKLLPLVLAGQPELADRLNDSSLRQLKQRVALRCEISPFDLPETAAYIAARIRLAGGEASRLFTREAVMLHSRVTRTGSRGSSASFAITHCSPAWRSGVNQWTERSSSTCAVTSTSGRTEGASSGMPTRCSLALRA